MKTRYALAAQQGSQQADAIYSAALLAGAPECVAHDLAGEPERARVNESRRKLYKNRSRRTIVRVIHARRTWELHVTKGWRSYHRQQRAPAKQQVSSFSWACFWADIAKGG